MEYNYKQIQVSKSDYLKVFYCDPFKLHKKRFSKGLHKTDKELVTILKIKPVQKLWRNWIKKKAREVTEHNAKEIEIYDAEEEYHFSNTTKFTLNKSAPLLAISPIKSVGRRDRTEYD